MQISLIDYWIILEEVPNKKGGNPGINFDGADTFLEEFMTISINK